MKEIRPSFLPVVGLLLGTALLYACAPVGRGVQRVGNAIHYESVALDHRVRDWFDTENTGLHEGRDREPITAWCYRTLGQITCYNQPIPGQEERLVGKQLPKPQFDALSYPIPDDKPEPPPLETEVAEDGVVEGGEAALKQYDAHASDVELVEKPVPVEVQELSVQPAVTPEAIPVPAVKPVAEPAIVPQLPTRSPVPHEIMPRTTKN